MDPKKRAREIYQEQLASKLAPEMQERYKARREAAVTAQDANFQSPEAVDALGDSERLRALQTGLQSAANKFGSVGGDGGQASGFGKTADALNQADRRQFETKQKAFQDAVGAEDAATRGELSAAQAQDSGLQQAGVQARTELEQGRTDEEYTRKQGLLTATDPRNVLQRNRLREAARRAGFDPNSITDDMTGEQAESTLKGLYESGKYSREGQKQTADLELSRAQSAKLRAEAGAAANPNPKKQFDNLPIDNQETIRGLAGQNVKKTSIKNQIAGMLKEFRSAKNSDDKVTIGGRMLKVLNSTEGADAIGEGEAKRLGAQLEFAFGNLFNSNPTQFGRDLPGFERGVEATVGSIDSAIGANKSEIDFAYGRPQQPRPVTPATPPPVQRKPKTISQNGHTYTLNEATGEYE